MTYNQIKRPRKNGVPTEFIQSWQASNQTGQKATPAIRRPLTACDSCRAAKVRCKGRNNSCERCTSRGIRCRFSSAGSTISSASSASGSDDFHTLLSDSVQAGGFIEGPLPSQDVQIEPVLSGSSEDTGTIAPLPLDGQVLDESPDNAMVDWSMAIPSQLFDWPSLDFGQYTTDPINDLQTTGVDATRLNEQTASLSDSNGIPPGSTPSLSCESQSRRNAEGTCQCRADLMAQVPEVKDAMEKTSPQLDQILSVTFKVLFVCRNLVACANCKISYADLVCAVAVLQQTETCLEHIVEQGLLTSSSAIKVRMGDYEVPFGNQDTLRHALVMDLVATANCLLDKLRVRSEGLAKLQEKSTSKTQSRLTRINMNYLQEVVRSFESTLRSIAESLERPSRLKGEAQK